MATSTSERIFVWTWLPGESEPVPAGVLAHRGGSDDLSFRYGDRYLERSGAVSLYGPELPLQRGTWFSATENLGMPGCLRDAAPDSWGRRVIINRRARQSFAETDTASLTESVYLLESDSNRLGAVDFQRSATEYLPREEDATLEQLQTATELVARGEHLPDGLRAAVIGGTAIGGARPKAILKDGDTQYIAKFSTSDDPLDVVGAEAASIYMARAIGIPVADWRVERCLDRKVLLLERFDRLPAGRRRMVVSGMTMLGVPETYIPIGTYPALLDVLRERAVTGLGLGRDVFQRIAFNIAISHSDDHLRNHAAFWDGAHLELTPAYDLSPVSRTGDSSDQALAYGRAGERRSNLASLIAACAIYDLSRPDAIGLVDSMITTMHESWPQAADAAQLTTVDRETMWGHQFLHPAALYDLTPRSTPVNFVRSAAPVPLIPDADTPPY